MNILSHVERPFYCFSDENRLVKDLVLKRASDRYIISTILNQIRKRKEAQQESFSMDIE